MREGGESCLKYLKREWNRTEGRGHKDFIKGGQAGSRGGCLKKGGLEPPYELCIYIYIYIYMSKNTKLCLNVGN